MKDQNYTKRLAVNSTPQEAFNAINNVTKWWCDDLEGSSQKLNDEFTVRFFDDIHVSTQRLVEVVPGKKVVWLVTYSNLNFVEDKHEWTGTRIIFDIVEKDKKTTEIHFTHDGLMPAVECFNGCSEAWAQYLESLRSLINTGKGSPTLKGDKLTV